MDAPSDQSCILRAFVVKMPHALLAGQVHLDFDESATAECSEVPYHPLDVLQFPP